MSAPGESDYYPVPVLVPQRPPSTLERRQPSFGGSGPASTRRQHAPLASTTSSIASTLYISTPTSVSSSTSTLFPASSPQVQYSAPYLQNIRMSRDTVIYKGLPALGRPSLHMRQLAPPQISVQTEQNGVNFHEIDKTLPVDPDTQLTIPTWELRTPSPEELAEEKEFEAAEAQWEDEYWKRVAAYRSRMKITPKQERSSQHHSSHHHATGRRSSVSGTSAAGQSRGGAADRNSATFNRGDSFRMDSTSNVPSPGQPSTAKKRKPPLPAAATKTSSSSAVEPPVATASGSSNIRGGSASSNRRSASTTSNSTVAAPANQHGSVSPALESEPMTAPSTPVNLLSQDSLNEDSLLSLDTSSVAASPVVAGSSREVERGDSMTPIPPVKLTSLANIASAGGPKSKGDKDLQGRDEDRRTPAGGELTSPLSNGSVTSGECVTPPQLSRGRKEPVQHSIFREATGVSPAKGNNTPLDETLPLSEFHTLDDGTPTQHPLSTSRFHVAREFQTKCSWSLLDPVVTLAVVRSPAQKNAKIFPLQSSSTGGGTDAETSDAPASKPKRVEAATTSSASGGQDASSVKTEPRKVDTTTKTSSEDSGKAGTAEESSDPQQGEKQKSGGCCVVM